HHRLHHHRNIYISRHAQLRATKLRRHHTDDRKALAVELQFLSNDISAAESTLPEPITDHDYRMGSRVLIVFKRDDSAQLSSHAESLEVVAGHDHPGHKIGPFGLPIAVQAGRDAAPCNHAVKDLILIAHLGVI